MDRDLRRRVRWGNVAGALGVLAVIAVVVAWPALAPEPPVVPGRETVPVGTPEPSPGAELRPCRCRAPVPRLRRGAGSGASRGRRDGRGRAAAARGVRVGPPRPRGGRSGAWCAARRRARAGGPVEARSAGGVHPPRPPRSPRRPHRAAPPVAPAAQGAPAPADPDPVLREFGPEGP